MLLILLACGEELPISPDQQMVPIAAYPLDGERVQSDFSFQGDIPPGVSQATIAIMVLDSEGNEQEYALLDSNGSYTYEPQAYYETNKEYCWSVWYYPANSKGFRSAQNCFLVTQ